MIARLLRILTAGSLFVFAAAAQAQSPNAGLWYAGGGIGGAWYFGERIEGAATGKLSMDPGFIGNVGIGRYIDETRSFRLEVEGLYSRATIDNNETVDASGDLSNLALMFNVLYDVQTNSSWVPYLGGGFGTSLVFLNDYSAGGVPVADDSSNAFAWQFKAGVAYHFSPSMAVTAQYRLFGTDNVTWKGVGGGSISSDGTKLQSAEVGFRFHF
jgi:opacity protein-like surface antigen